MSKPQFLVVAVICGEVNYKKDARIFGGEKAAAVAAILKGQSNENEPAPYFLPVAFSECRLSLIQAGLSKGLGISHQPLYPRLLNPQEIDIWLALDQDGFDEAQNRIQESGTAPNKYYREVFPETVMHCGFSLPETPSDLDFQPWLDFLSILFAPWKQRIWRAFFDSS